MTSTKRKPAAGARGGLSEYSQHKKSDGYQENSWNANRDADALAEAQSARKDARKKGVFKIGKAVIAEMSGRFSGKAPRWVLRLREIEKLIKSRHNGLIPEPGGCDDDDLCIAYFRAVAGSGSRQSLTAWAARWAPWATTDDLEPIAREFETRKYMLKADQVAQILFVRNDERNALDLRTIGACNMSKAERQKLTKERKRQRDREAKELKRRAAGSQPRSGSIEANRPWESAGMSRRSWYRKKQIGTVPALIGNINIIGDRTVPNAENQNPHSEIVQPARRA